MNNTEQILEWLKTAKGDRVEEFNLTDLDLILNLGLEEYCELAESQGNKGLEVAIKCLTDKLNNVLEKSRLSEDKLKTGKKELLNAIVDIEWVAKNALYHANISSEEYQEEFDKTTKSNFSKFCHSEQEVVDTVDKYKKQNIDIYSTFRNGRYVFFRADGKVLKGINYKEPNEF